MGLGNIGMGGLIMIMLIVLIMFGPSKLPELGRAFGRTLREFKSGAHELIEDDTVKKEPLVDSSSELKKQ